MPWAVFHKQFNYRPPGQHSFKVKPSTEPQERKTALIKAAVEAGVATQVDAPNAGETKGKVDD